MAKPVLHALLFLAAAACSAPVNAGEADTSPNVVDDAVLAADPGPAEALGEARCSPAAATGPVGQAEPALEVGPGFSDVSPHQLVRSRANVLYVVTPTCSNYPSCQGNALRAWRGDVAGTPSAFVEVDPSHAPSSQEGSVGSSAVALDGCDRLHVLWNDRAGELRHAVLDTTTDRWGPVERVASTHWTTFGQGDEGVALALDAAGVPFAVWSGVQGGRLRLFLARNVQGAWTSPEGVDDAPLSADRRALHPAVAFAPDGTFVVAWLEGTDNYFPDGVIRVRSRSPGGAWGPSVALPEPAMTAIDNGPSLLVTADGVRHVTFDDVTNRIRHWYDAGAGWKGDRQPASQVTHNPSLGPDGYGGVYIWGHGEPADGTLKGEGFDLFRFHLPAGATAWGPWTRYVAGRFDSSVGTRWSQFFHHYPATVDVVFWTPDEPNVLFLGTE